MKKVTQQDIDKFLELYPKLGSYKAVAEETGFSASTVGKYIKASKPKTPAVEFRTVSQEALPDFSREITEPFMDNAQNFEPLCHLTEAEATAIKEMWKELGE